MSAHRLLLGTHTSNQAQNYIQIAQVEVPDFRTPDVSELDEQRGEAGGYGNAKKPFDFKVIQKINHPGEVNKARYQPQNPDIIASLCVDGRVLIFDRTKHPMTPKADGTIKTEAELIGHEKEGFGLSWSPLLEGHIATGNEDTTVRIWDLKSGFSKTNSSVASISTYTHHTATVNDVQYHPIHSFLIGSVSDDLTWQIIDTRAPQHHKALYKKEAAHADAVNCIAFHPQMEVTMATGSADKTVALWDLRNFDNKIHSLESHKDAVMNLQWHPQDSAILASSSYDRRICMWDLSKIGEEQTFEEQEDGPPELYVRPDKNSVYANRRPASSCTVASPTGSATSTGIRTTPGSCSRPPRTTRCKFSALRASLLNQLRRTPILTRSLTDLTPGHFGVLTGPGKASQGQGGDRQREGAKRQGSGRGARRVSWPRPTDFI